MLERLLIDGGPSVDLDGAPAQGTRHEVRFGVLADSTAAVVVKLERVAGALDRERTALTWLGTAHPGVAPELVAYGKTDVAGDSVSCLVMQRCTGAPPTSVEGWGRMGGALARLARLDHPECGLPRLQPEEFVRGHADRVHELGARLDPFVTPIPDWPSLSRRTLPEASLLVLTHGDPGPGNYLDTGATGTLIDWEEAQIAPIGLDLARLMFIALLGSGPSGYTATDQLARCQATAGAYLDAVAGRWRPSPEDLRWWLSVAAIQFIHRRWQLGGRPAPWEHAAEVLRLALSRRSGIWLAAS